MAKWKLTDAEFEAQYEAALAAEDASVASGPTAVDAYLDAGRGLIWVRLDNGCVFGFPPTLVEGLHDASPEVLANVEVLPRGVGLRWEILDIDLSIAGLLMGVFGSRTWMTALGRLGGKSKSEAKAQAARANGRKGGRPRKDASNLAEVANAEGRDPGPPEYWSPDPGAAANALSITNDETVAPRRWSSRTPGARTPGGSNTPAARSPQAA